ncbi:MAG: hypothetical protein LBU11_12330 [Zoogloeaceae bacterium]|jgi:hypothetical protein|nr:hypothetical protein [Zoogloeaceae bacterium]
MRAADAIRWFRQDAFDTERPHLWSDDEALRYLADARAAFVADIGGIMETGGDLGALPVYKGEARVPISPLVKKILRAQLDGERAPLALRHISHLSHIPQDRSPPGTPRFLITGADTGAIRLSPTPDKDYGLTLALRRLPLFPIRELDDEVAEVEEAHIPALIAHMKQQAYSRPDADGYDPNRARTAQVEYHEQMLAARAARERLNWRPARVAYGGL